MQGTPVRKQGESLIENVLSFPHLYDYVMIRKLLMNYFGSFARIVTRPALNLSFNASDVQNLEFYDRRQVIKHEDGLQIQYREISSEELLFIHNQSLQNNEVFTSENYRVDIFIMVNFLGLYGSSSPLPIYYSEDLIRDQADDNDSTTDFLGFLNEPIYEQYNLSVKNTNCLLDWCRIMMNLCWNESWHLRDLPSRTSGMPILMFTIFFRISASSV